MMHYYQHSEIGYNYRMSNICAGIGRGQMEVLDSHVNCEERNAWYQDFKSIPGVTVFKNLVQIIFNHWLTAIMIDRKIVGKTNEDLRLALEAVLKAVRCVEAYAFATDFASYPYYGSDVAELYSDGLCLPSGSNLNGGDDQRIAES
jgi:dTDP-4-amino-4,6-dideoxygalactose transaminase